MAKKPGGTRTLAVVAFERGGYMKAHRALLWLVEWGIASDAEGRPLQAEEVAHWWQDSAAKAYRDQRTWRELFPDLEVSTVWPQARKVTTSKSRAAALEVGGLTVGGLS